MQGTEVSLEAVECHQAGDRALAEGRFVEAEELLRRAEFLYERLISYLPDEPILLSNLGGLMARSRRLGLAIVLLKRAVEKAPEMREAWSNLGAAYRTNGNIEKALEAQMRALEIEPDHPATLSNISGIFVNRGKPEECLMYANRALQLNPDLAEAENHKALALLEMGKYEEGFSHYDARLRVPGFHRREYGSAPMWDGSPTGKLAIHGEQGLGDEIMFLTCLEQLKDRAKEIAIECSPRLVKLLQSSLPYAKVFGSHTELCEAFKPDSWIAMGSLPRLCWPVKPNAYLKPQSFYPKGRRIGLSWFGGTLKTHEELRNTKPEAWRTFLDLDAEFVSLQYGPRESQAELIGIPHDSEKIGDLDKLAALIRSCDLVISVCNTTIHMAGALGVPCLVLVPNAPAWRYGLTGEKMIWYDSPVMIRQGNGESWASVLQRAKDRCADYGYLPRSQRAAA